MALTSGVACSSSDDEDDDGRAAPDVVLRGFGGVLDHDGMRVVDITDQTQGADELRILTLELGDETYVLSRQRGPGARLDDLRAGLEHLEPDDVDVDGASGFAFGNGARAHVVWSERDGVVLTLSSSDTDEDGVVELAGDLVYDPAIDDELPHGQAGASDDDSTSSDSP